MTLRLKAGNKYGATEKQEQAAIVKLLRSIGASVYVLGHPRRKGDYQGTGQTPGVPDLYVHLTSHKSKVITAVWIEVKRSGGRLRQEQQAFRVECKRAFVDHVVGGIDDVIAFLREHDFLK